MPVAKETPPVKPPNHEIVPPAQPLAVMLTVPVPQRLPPALVGELGIEFMITFAVAVAVQPSPLITVTV